jgi:capsular polysaccharide biosynthesis protein
MLRNAVLTKWAIATAVAVVVAGIVLSQAPPLARSAVYVLTTNVAVSGPVERESQYYVDTNEVARDVSKAVPVYMMSDAILAQIAAGLESGLSKSQVEVAIDVSMPTEGLLSVRVAHGELETAQELLDDVVGRVFAVITDLERDRFPTDSPLTASILSETVDGPAAGGSIVPWFVLAGALALVAGASAAVFRYRTDGRVRTGGAAVALCADLGLGTPVVLGREQAKRLLLSTEQAAAASPDLARSIVLFGTEEAVGDVAAEIAARADAAGRKALVIASTSGSADDATAGSLPCPTSFEEVQTQLEQARLTDSYLIVPGAVDGDLTAAEAYAPSAARRVLVVDHRGLESDALGQISPLVQEGGRSTVDAVWIVTGR